jgi:hypothetical protein
VAIARRPRVIEGCTEDDLRGDPGDEWTGAGYVCTW